REAAIAREDARLRLDRAKLAQLPQRLGPGHHDIGVEAGLAVDLQQEIAERDCSGADHLYDGWLRDGYHHDIVEIEIGVSRLRLRPRRERAEDVIAEQRHQVIA